MAFIYVDVNQVMSMNQAKRRYTGKLDVVRDDLIQLNDQVNSEIKSRNNIDLKFRKATTKINDLNYRIQRLHTFIDQSMDIYMRNEEKLTRQAEEVMNRAENGTHKPIWHEIRKYISWGLPYARFFMNSKSLRLMDMSMNLRFKRVKKNGMQYITVRRWPNKYQPGDLRDLLAKYLGGKRWSWSYATKLLNGGIPLYDLNKNAYNKKYASRMSYTKFDELNQYIKNMDKKLFPKVLSSAKSGFAEEARVWKDFDWRKTTTLTKFGKSAGIAGTVLGIVGNVSDAFYNPEREGGASNGENWRRFLVNTAVDVGLGGSAVAAGAAVGSLIVPPLGTVVGAGVGLALNTLVNVDLVGDPKTSIANYAKQKANQAVDAVADFGKKLFNDIGKGFGAIFG